MSWPHIAGQRQTGCFAAFCRAFSLLSFKCKFSAVHILITQEELFSAATNFCAGCAQATLAWYLIIAKEVEKKMVLWDVDG